MAPQLPSAPSVSDRRSIVVYVGIDTRYLPDSFSPEDKAIAAGIAAAMSELTALGFDTRWCGVSTDVGAAMEALRAALSAAAVDIVLIGAGLRKGDQAVMLFERIVNEVHRTCPQASICFNTVPEDSAAAVQRWR
jgi:hypothetical protein